MLSADLEKYRPTHSTEDTAILECAEDRATSGITDTQSPETIASGDDEHT